MKEQLQKKKTNRKSRRKNMLEGSDLCGTGKGI
jgi:hypothetical protein